MEVVDQWTALHACALQFALRLTQDELAASLGVARRTVSTWHEKPDVVLRPEFQRALDTAYERATEQEKIRFVRQLRTLGTTNAASAELPKSDLGALARSHVLAAREKLGMNHAKFATLLSSLLGWSPSSSLVESWETSVVPPGDVILAVGVATQGSSREALALPVGSDGGKLTGVLSTVMPDLEKTLGSPDVVAVHAMRGLIARPKWNSMLRGAKESIWLYGMSELGYALDDEVPGLLQEAACEGCDVRILLLDPRYEGIDSIDADEGSPAGTLAPRIRSALARFGQMAEACGPRMQVRVYSAPPTASIVRGDHRMLVTPYLRFFVGSNSPTLELQQTETGGMFDRYCRHFENTWNLAKDWTG